MQNPILVGGGGGGCCWVKQKWKIKLYEKNNKKGMGKKECKKIKYGEKCLIIAYFWFKTFFLNRGEGGGKHAPYDQNAQYISLYGNQFFKSHISKQYKHRFVV